MKVQVIYHFQGADGETPLCALMQGADGALYGTATHGGDSGLGTIYKINPDGTGFQVLHVFSGGGNDGAKPCGALVQGADGALYGTTSCAGATDDGVIFKINPDGTGFRILRCLLGYEDGSDPSAGLILGKDGALYGTATHGGSWLWGTIFRIHPDGTNFQVLHAFTGYPLDGAHPFGALLQGDHGELYGTTKRGGAQLKGVVFKIRPTGTCHRILHKFELKKGAYPSAGLILGNDGALYGTATCGGGRGLVFRLHTDGCGFEVTHQFTRENNDGAYPQASLLQASDGFLYGTATHGGTDDRGMIFRMNPDGSEYEILHNFGLKSCDGAYPCAALIEGKDGALYGTTPEGGTHNKGVVYRLNLT